METIKLTKEQSAALEKMRDCHHLRNDKEALLVKHAAGWKNAYETLNEIPMLGFAQLVLNDFAYEIEPEQPKFQAGEKVIHIDQQIADIVFTLTHKMPVNEVAWKFDNGGWDYEKRFRHATPEEIYWLETLNRNSVKDFHIGDIYIDREFRAEILENDRHVQLAQIWYADGDFKGLYPAESFRPFKKE